MPGAHKIGAAISGPRIAGGNFMHTRLFLVKRSTKEFCDTIATSIAWYEKYRCWASKHPLFGSVHFQFVHGTVQAVPISVPMVPRNSNRSPACLFAKTAPFSLQGNTTARVPVGTRCILKLAKCWEVLHSAALKKWHHLELERRKTGT